MPPRKLKSREGNAELPDLVSKFPFRVGDEVEMKSHESGYRGAWFRVQIKKIRLGRKGNIMSTMVYRDYTDEIVVSDSITSEGEEEIRVFEKDPANDDPILMVRPLPPPTVKESKFNKSVHTKMCVVYRDEWEVGDLVDWWYHHCWWAAKVISVVGDGRFQLVCPAPPGGEGGVYLANSRDLRPSLRWSITAQWTAPPSKEIGKIPCARIVWLLDSNEVAGFAAPNQDKVPVKRGRPKLARGISTPLVRKDPATVAPLNPGYGLGKIRRPRVMQLKNSPCYNHRAVETAAPSKDTRVAPKRGRPRKALEVHEAGQERRRPIMIKIIHPRQQTGNEKAEHMLKSPLVDETSPQVKEYRSFDICLSGKSPEVEMRQGAQQEIMAQGKGLGEGYRAWAKKVSPLTEEQQGNVNKLGTEQTIPINTNQIDEGKPGVKQKRSVIRTPDNIDTTLKNQIANGHSDQVKRRKLEHITGVLEAEVGDQDSMMQNLPDQDCKKPQDRMPGEEAGDNTPKDGLLTVLSKARKKQKKSENKVGSDSTVVSCTADGVVEHVLDLVPRQQITLPFLSKGKESSADHVSGQQSKDGNQNGGRQVEVFSSKFASNPMNGEVKVVEEELSDVEVCKEALDLKVLKVLNAYEEAFTDTLCLETKNTLNHDPSTKEYNNVLMNDCCLMVQKSVVATKDVSVVKAYEEAFTKDIWSPRKKLSLAQDSSPASGKLAKSREFSVSCNQKTLWKGNVPQVSSPYKGMSSLDTRSSTLQDRHTEKSVNVSTVMSHEYLIGTEASSMDTISIGGSPDSLSGRIPTVSIEEDIKDIESSRDGASVVDEENSWSSLESSQVNQSRKNANVGLNACRDGGMKAEKSDKNEVSSIRKKKMTKPVMKHKVTLSRKLIVQARREVSAKMRRSCRNTGRG